MARPVFPMRLLLSGFEPFGGSGVNPSQLAMAAIAAEPPAGVEVLPLLLPVVGGVAPRKLVAAIRRAAPDAVLMLGESAKATGLTVERVAINLRDYRIPDNAGRTVRDRPVVLGGPPAYFATLPVRRLLEALGAAGVPAAGSLSAGSFLCNEVMYAALHALRDSGVPCGFVHLPRLPEQVRGRRGAPRMPLVRTCDGLRTAIAALAAARRR